MITTPTGSGVPEKTDDKAVMRSPPSNEIATARSEAFELAIQYLEEMRRGFLAHAEHIKSSNMSQEFHSSAMASATKHAEFAEDIRRISRGELPVYGSPKYKTDLQTKLMSKTS